MRVYLPLLREELTELARHGRTPARVVYGVTDELRRLDATADEEDLEFEAMCQALDAARSLGSGRRVVVAADAAAREGSGEGAALLGEEALAVADVVSFHVEETESEAGEGYDDLLWYDVTELAALVTPDAP